MHTSADDNVFLVNIVDTNQLFYLYLPFIANGGLFVQTDKPFTLGDEVFLLVKLIEVPEKYKVQGKVVWITPVLAQGNRPTGVGIQFNQDAAELRAKIETYLADSLGTVYNSLDCEKISPFSPV